MLPAFALLALSVDVPRPFIEANCVGCHRPERRSGGLDLTGKPDEATWVRVHDRVRAGEMPPRKRPEGADAFVRGLGAAITAEQVKRRVADGRAVIRRLNRTEYENTLRDLLDLPGLNVKELLPDDGRADGYDRSAAALDVSPILLAKYADAADAALDLAIAKTAVPPEVYRERMYAHQQYDFGVVIPNGDGVMLKDFKYDASRFPVPKDAYAGGKFKGLGELERSAEWKEPGTAGLFRTLGESFPGRFQRFSPVYPGRYRVTLSTWSFWWDKGEVKPSPRTQAAGVYYGGRLLGFFDAPSLRPTQHTVEAYLEPGEYLKFDAASLWEVHPYAHKGKAAGFTGPGVALDFLDVEGPLHDEWPPPSHKRLFGDLPLTKLPKEGPPRREAPRQLKLGRNGPGRVVFATVAPARPAAEAEKLLAAFLPRAFRRPVPPTEAARYLTVALGRLGEGACFEEAMRSAYKAALCSADFLFLRQPAGPLDEHALAARLSYFLWNSCPDDELTRLADRGALISTVRAQAERMLADPKAGRFVADFLDQWLDLREIDATTPDRGLYPEYTPYLRDAIRREPAAYLTTLLREDRPALELVRSGYALVNQRLAEHYGIPGVEGTRFRNVGVPPGSGRGGFPTQAAVLKVTANGTTTSPVKRGAWVMRKVLGRPPEPPPPDVAAVEPDVRGATTIREQLAKHRDNPSCAGCHAKIDPPGFALETFDVIGGLRSRYRSVGKGDAADLTKAFPSHLGPDGRFSTAHYHVGFRDGPKVDATGETVDGKPFAGIDDFKRLLSAEERGLALNLANQLISYATGAPVGFADRAEVERILAKAGPGFRVRSLVHEIIRSPLFLEK